MRGILILIAVAIGSLGPAHAAFAQDRPRPVVEAVVGTSGFVDEVWDYFFTAGAGYLRQRTIVGSGPGSTALQPFTSGEATFSGGIGARIALGERFFVAPEVRIGWEPEMRFVAMIGFRPGR